MSDELETKPLSTWNEFADAISSVPPLVTTKAQVVETEVEDDVATLNVEETVTLVAVNNEVSPVAIETEPVVENIAETVSTKPSKTDKASGLVDVVLLQNHKHAGKEYLAGDTISVTKHVADFLTNNGIAN